MTCRTCGKPSPYIGAACTECPPGAARREDGSRPCQRAVVVAQRQPVDGFCGDRRGTEPRLALDVAEKRFAGAV